MTLDEFGRPVHSGDGTTFGLDSWATSFGEEIDLSAQYAAWFDSLVSGPLFHVSGPPAPVTETAPACVIEGFTFAIAGANVETVGTIGAAEMMVPQAIQTYGV